MPQHFPLSEIIQGLLEQLEKNYIFPAKVPEIATNLQQNLEQGIYNDISDGEILARMFSEQLQATSQDKHLRLIYQADGVPVRMQENEVYTPEEIERIAQKKQKNYGIQKVEILEGNIGLLQINEFVHPHFAGETMRAAMTLLAHTQALIIDLRTCGGGEGLMVQFLCSYFFSAFEAEHIQLNGLYDRRQDLLRQYWVLSYLPGSRYQDKPVYVLTSSRTFSAAEECTYDLQQRKRAIVVGEQTRGGAHAGNRFPIHTHFEAFIPNTRAINPVSGTNWEGVGVQPDILISEAEALDIAYQRALVTI